MSFAEFARNTDEKKAHDLVTELFHEEETVLDDFINTEKDMAATIPMLKGFMDGADAYIANLVDSGKLSEEDGVAIIAGVSMASILVSAYIDSETPDVPPTHCDEA